MSGAGSMGDQFKGNMPGGMISAAGNKGHAEGTTQAAVAEGTLTIRDKANQQQDVADLSRDTEHANDSISPIFDKEKEQNRLKEIGMISDIGNQAADIARTQGDLNGLKAAQKDSGETLPDNATEEQRQAYIANLRDSQAYKDEMAKYGTGSDMQRGIQAATAALQGLAGGNMAGALAGASAPELANIIGHHAGIDDNTAAKAIAHAILGGVTAALQGNSAAAGAVGAGTGEVIAVAIAKNLYPGVEASKLTEDQKQTVSTLATLSAGMAGGIAGGDVAGAAAGASAGKNVAENNALSFGNGFESNAAAAASWNQYAVNNNLTPEETQAGLDKIAKGDMPDSTNITKVIVDGYQNGVMIAGGLYLAPEVAIAKGISGAVISGGANTAYQYLNLKPGQDINYYDVATATGAGYLAPGYNVPVNVFISTGGAFLAHGPDTASLGGAIAGTLGGGLAGKFAPALLKPIFGTTTGFWAETGSAFASEVSSDATQKAINKAGVK